MTDSSLDHSNAVPLLCLYIRVYTHHLCYKEINNYLLLILKPANIFKGKLLTLDARAIYPEKASTNTGFQW